MIHAHSAHARQRSQSFLLRRALPGLAGTLLAAHALAGIYTFVRIDPGNLVSVYPGDLNNRGEVCYTAFTAGNNSAIVKGSGGPLTTIAATGAAGWGFTYFNAPFITCRGSVAFRAIAAQNGAYRGNGGVLTKIYSASNGVDPSAIDDDGSVVFYDNAIGIMTGSGGAASTIAGYGSLFSGFASLPDIQSGIVAFNAILTSNGQSAIYTSKNGVLTQVAVAGGSVAAVQFPRLNRNGDMLWVENASSGVQAIISRIGGANSTFVDTTGPFAQFGFYNGYTINTSNQIAFSATLKQSPGLGIYTGPNPTTDGVIVPGDTLANKTVRDAYFGGMNDRGQISFGVMFSDFTFGVFRADPPNMPPVPDCPPCLGDFIVNNFVNDDDFVFFVHDYNILDCGDFTMTFGCPSDLNGDGFVDDLDFEIFNIAYIIGPCP